MAHPNQKIPRIKRSNTVHSLQTFASDKIWPFLLAISGFSVLFGGWESSAELMEAVLKASCEDSEEANKLTQGWQDHKLKELEGVAITSALVATTVTGAFVWPDSANAPTATCACWYSALIFAVIAITSASQQSNILRKVYTMKGGGLRLRSLLRTSREQRNPDCTSKNSPSQIQFFVWQTPIMLLNFSILLFVAGLMTMVFRRAVESRGEGFGKEGKVAVVFGLAAGVAGGCYLFSMINLYSRTHRMTEVTEDVEVDTPPKQGV